MTAWFRRPDGVLVAAQFPAQLDRCIDQGYEPVDEGDAIAEVQSGAQERLNDARADEDTLMRERELAAERQRKAQQHREKARQIVADAALEVTPPKPPRASRKAVAKALDEAGPETRR